MLPQPSLTVLAGLQPPVFEASKESLLLLLLLLQLTPVDIILSCPDTITLITVAKTLITANPGCFPWTSQANNYSPNRKCPSDSPPPESSWVCDSPIFSSLQPQLWDVCFAVGTPYPYGLPQRTTTTLTKTPLRGQQDHNQDPKNLRGNVGELQLFLAFLQQVTQALSASSVGLILHMAKKAT